MGIVAAPRRLRDGLLVPLLAGVAIRLVVLFAGEGDPGDGVNRTLTAATWLREGYRLLGAHTWPELNYLLPAAAIKVTGEYYWGVRALYSLVSLALVPLVWWIGRALADATSARVGAFAAALLPYVVVLGTDGARGEPGFVVASLAAVWCAQRWVAGSFAPHLAVLAAVGVVAAEGFRFDGVVIGAAIGAAMTLAAAVRRWRDGDHAIAARAVLGLALFAVLSLAYPLALGLEWQQRYGDPLHFMHTAQANSAQFLVDGGHARWSPWFYRAYCAVFPVAGAAYLLTPLFALVAAIGVWQVRRQPVAWPVIAAALGYGVYFTRSTVTALAQPQLRYAAVLGMLLLPFLAPGVAAIRAAWGAGRLRSTLRGAVAVAVAVQAVVVLVTLRPAGILTRQLAGTGLVGVARFETRALLPDVASAGAADSIFVSGFVPGSYVYLARPWHRQNGLRFLSHYIDGVDVLTSAAYQERLASRLRAGTADRLLLVDLSGRELGFPDGLHRDPIGQQFTTASPGTEITWRGLRLALIVRRGGVALLRVR